MCHNAFVTLCHQDSFKCHPFIFVGSFIDSDASELEAIYKTHFDIWRSLRDGPLGKHKCKMPNTDCTCLYKLELGVLLALIFSTC